jgi:hypothetical protein
VAGTAIGQIKPDCIEYTGNDPLGFVIRANLLRRHLTTSQRAMMAAKIADHKPGRSKQGELTTPKGVVSSLMQVGERTVDRAKAVRASVDGDLIDAIESGAMTVGAAHKSIQPVDDPDVIWKREFLRLKLRTVVTITGSVSGVR